jgi:hypothetical protein
MQKLAHNFGKLPRDTAFLLAFNFHTRRKFWQEGCFYGLRVMKTQFPKGVLPMKSTIWVCALGAAFVAAQAAHADTVQGSYTFTDTTNSNTLNITATPNPGTFTESVADNGISTTDNFFFYVTANIPGNASSTQTDNLDVSFSITEPGTGSGSQSGQGTEDQDIWGIFNYTTGSITWNAPADIALSDGQTLYIDLGDITLTQDSPFNGYCGFSGADMCGEETATFTLTPDPSPTPEPGSLALLGTSILGGAGLLRRRFQA